MIEQLRCMEHAHKLTSWEMDFVEELEDKLDHGEDLTEKQADKLDQIYEERVENA